MARKAQLGFLAAALVWLTWGQEHSAANAIQCTAGGAVVQDNFHPLLNGWYCSGNPFDGAEVCTYNQETNCEPACIECGFAGLASTNTCIWNHSPQPGPDPSAMQYGCGPGIWAVRYQIGCNCYYLPSCQPNGTFCTDAPQCCSNICGNETMICGMGSPVLINLAGNSRDFDLTNAANGVQFDIDGDGDQDRISWTEAESEIAFLAFDRNGNGAIDSGKELFGNATRLGDGSVAEHGFEALADLDSRDGNGDGQIDETDEAFGSLRIWVDRNHNGQSEVAELRSLEQAGVTTIFTAYRESRRVDRNGNRYAFVGHGLVQGARRERRRAVFDVFFTALP